MNCFLLTKATLLMMSCTLCNVQWIQKWKSTTFKNSAGMYPCSTKTREVLGNPSPTPERFPETREISRGRTRVGSLEGSDTMSALNVVTGSSYLYWQRTIQYYTILYTRLSFFDYYVWADILPLRSSLDWGHNSQSWSCFANHAGDQSKLNINHTWIELTGALLISGCFIGNRTGIQAASSTPPAPPLRSPSPQQLSSHSSQFRIWNYQEPWKTIKKHLEI